MENLNYAGLCLAMTLLLGQSAVRQPQTYVLDFIADQPSAEKQAEADKTGGYVRPLAVQFHPGDGPVPFEVTLVGLDRNGYTMGDDVVFDIALKVQSHYLMGGSRT